MTERQCTGDCLKCPFQQHTYCAAQRTYAILKNQETIIRNQETIVHNQEELSAKLNSLGMAPAAEVIPFEAQEGRGAENSSPEKIND